MNYKEVVRNIRGELEDYITENKLKSLVIGVSGGIDSAVCVALAKPVCDDMNIPLIGRSIPIESNKQDEIDRADKIGEQFCHNYKKIPFDKIFRQFNERIEIVENKDNDKIAKGNIKARLRMIYLYNIAGMNNGMVIGTSNYTEILLDFFSIGGDGCVDYELIYPLWKTEVYELANYIVENELVHDCAYDAAQAIKDCINCEPTDGLGISNSDVEQFGVNNYQEVDEILKNYIYRVELGFQSEKIKELEQHPVIQRYNKRFKHNIPICPKRINYGLTQGA